MTLNLRQQNAGADWNYAQMSGGIRRYELRDGDVIPGERSVGSERSESYDSNHFDVGKTYQATFKFMIEPGATNAAPWLLLSQIASQLDPGEAAHSPPFAMELAGDKLRIVTRDSSAALSTAADVRYVRQYDDSQPMTRGRWYDIKMQFAFGPSGNGMLKVWRDDKLLVNFTGAFGFNDVVGPYFKQGVYRSAAPQTIAIQFKDLAFGAAK
ncbi:heparin lyase I family protein [Sphingobium sp. SCG-1]|uniref:heparin lyase I family protein n=1 Tax=Sphingobium sp. SCG-1 TaxID=2072936 RepID=UPI001670C784|nr:heparin lyase I family protein [Sphingobium sp. SCG-1]